MHFYLGACLLLNSSSGFDAVDQQHSSCRHLFSIKVKNSVNFDQMALSKASWYGSTVIPKKNKSEFSRTRVNALYIYPNVLYFSLMQEMSIIGLNISYSILYVQFEHINK